MKCSTESTSMLRMAFYGIFRLPFCGRRLGGTVVEEGKRITGFCMRCGGGISFVSKTDNPQDSVVVDVIDVPAQKILGDVDHVEGHPVNYVRTWIKEHGFWIYLKNRPVSFPVVIDGDYVAEQAREERQRGVLRNR